MFKKCFISLISLVLLLILISSCRDLVLDDFPEYDDTIVANSILIEGTPITVHLSRTGSIDSFQLPPIDNAEIELWVNDEFTENLTNSGQGFYSSEINTESLKNYLCKIIIPENELILCQQMIPESIPIIELEHVNIAGRDEEGTSYPAITLSFPNKTSQRNYYEVIIKYFISYSGQTEQYTASIHSFSDPVILNEGIPAPLFSNEVIKDTVYSITLNYTTSGSHLSTEGIWRTTLFPIIVELRTISYDYYYYKKQFYLYEEGRMADGLLNAITSFPLYSNIEKANGIFAGYSVFTSDTIRPEPYEK